MYLTLAYVSFFRFSSFFNTKFSKVIVSAKAVSNGKRLIHDTEAEFVEWASGNRLPLVNAADLSPRMATRAGL